MPHVEYSYNPIYKAKKMQEFGVAFEGILRSAIQEVRPGKNDYRITVKGAPHPMVSVGLGAIDMNIFYHDEWGFTEKEKERILRSIRHRVREKFSHIKGSDEEIKIRLYPRTGYVGITVV